jgi:uncharacterized protein YdcH (DUF465 family)
MSVTHETGSRAATGGSALSCLEPVPGTVRAYFRNPYTTGMTIMLGEKHDILHEFPNLEETINSLHENNAEFAELMDNHDKLDNEIRDLEERDQPTSDVHMEELKKQRALLKDRIYSILRSQS